MLIQKIRSFEKYENFIGELAADPSFYDPHFTFDKDNLYGSSKRRDEFAFVVSEDGKTEGLFVWLVLPEDQYIEMIIGLTHNEEAFSEMLSYMEKNYRGFQMDFVFNPLNTAVSRPLKARGAAFDPEQQKMMTGSLRSVAFSTARVIFSPTTLPIEAIMKRQSITQMTASSEPIMPLPVTTASSSDVRFLAEASLSS